MMRFRRLVTAALAALMLVLFALGATAAGKPVLITSVGQSAEISMIKTLAVRGKIPFEEDALAKAEVLTGSDKQSRYSAVVAVVGGSAKGLGAAGINKDQETDRAKALLERAKSLKLNIVIMHVGGEERRGDLSDAFIRAVVPYANQVILVEAGDKDGLFEQVLRGKSVPIVKVTRISETLEPLKKALGM